MRWSLPALLTLSYLSTGALSLSIGGQSRLDAVTAAWKRIQRAEAAPLANATSGPCHTRSRPGLVEEIKLDLEKGQRISKRQTTIKPHVISVHFNILAANMTYEGGWVPDTQIADQVAVLNAAYESAGFSFRHDTTTRIIKPTWWSDIIDPSTRYQTFIITAFGTIFRQGDETTLNINSIGLTNTGEDSTVLGFAYFPTEYRSTPELDGIYIRSDAFPGGSSRLRQGGTAIHEVGHWLGLFHTFEGGCIGEGDGVADTPAQRDATGTRECPIGRDSCPGSPGLDPIHNYMDYSSESCRTEFTPGQIMRMQAAMDYYRS